MGIIKGNKLLFDNYLKTGDTQLIHEIIINSENSIKRCIRAFLKANNIDECMADEYFSSVYLGVYNKLAKSTDYGETEDVSFYYYLRREVYKMLKQILHKNKSIEENVVYSGLLNNEIFKYEFNEDEFINDFEQKEIIRKCINKLEPLRRKAIVLRFGLNGTRPMSLEQIAQKMNISDQRVSMLIITGLKTLEKMITSKDKNNLIISNRR